MGYHPFHSNKPSRPTSEDILQYSNESGCGRISAKAQLEYRYRSKMKEWLSTKITETDTEHLTDVLIEIIELL